MIEGLLVVWNRLRQSELIGRAEQHVLLRLAHVGIHEKGASPELCERDREFGAKLRTPLARAWADDGEDIRSAAGLVQQQKLGAQGTQALAARIVRIVSENQHFAG